MLRNLFIPPPSHVKVAPLRKSNMLCYLNIDFTTFIYPYIISIIQVEIYTLLIMKDCFIEIQDANPGPGTYGQLTSSEISSSSFSKKGFGGFVSKVIIFLSLNLCNTKVV